nr:PepSY-like domain-containing protein [Alistipes sp.]
MRRITMLFAAMLFGIMATTAACVSDHDRLVDFDKLPAKAKSFIKQNFADEKIAHILYDSELTDRDYKVRFENGTEVEFDNDGKWTKVDCQRSAVPSAIVPHRDCIVC